MASYHMFTSTTTDPDPVALLTQLRSIDATAGVQHEPGHTQYVIKTATVLTAPKIASIQSALDSAPTLTPQRRAQNEIDSWPIAVKALVLALIDQINVIRAELPTPRPPVTPQQALAAIRAKAGTL